MPEIQTFNLPDLGEGLTDGEILRWLVGPGDRITLNQPIVEVETAKAAVEIPSPYAGLVTELHHPEGATVEVGTPIITIDVASGASPAGNEASPRASAQPAEDAPTPAAERTPVLVGYGPRSGSAARRRPRRAEAPVEPEIGGSGLAGDPAGPAPDETLALLPTIPDTLAAGAKPVRHGGLEMGRAAERAAQAAQAAPPAAPLAPPARSRPETGPVSGPRVTTATRAMAKPPVRKLARDLGVDLSGVPPTGPHGSVTRDDVQRAAAARNAVPEPAVVDASLRERRIAVRGVRKLTAEAMVASVMTAPHVTEFLTVDVTRTLKAVKRFREDPAFADVRVGPLLLIAKAVLLAAARYPELNSTWVSGPTADEIVLKDYVNLGIAAATPRGLIVPNIKAADQLPLPELASALDALVRVAKAGKTPPADLVGGTITITNVGVFGVDSGTPILNPGESAILCVGQIAERPWVHRGALAVRSVCQLALSFDHRIVDGEAGSKFLADVGRFLADPASTALAWS